MRFPVGVLMVGFGYAIVYWGLARVFAFGPSDGSQLEGSKLATHNVTTLGMYLGIPLKSQSFPTVSYPPVHIGYTPSGAAQPATSTPAPSKGGVQNV